MTIFATYVQKSNAVTKNIFMLLKNERRASKITDSRDNAKSSVGTGANMSDKKFTIELEIDNIGPHHGENKISFTDEVSSNKIVFFAANGIGKSFISRSFRLLAPEKRTENADDLLTLGTSTGKLSFSMINGATKKNLSINLEKEKLPVIYNDTGLIFHVYNNDFVEENI